MVTPNLGLDNLVANQSNPEVVYNTMLRRLDMHIQTSVINLTTTATPAASEGDIYIIGGTPTGQWSTDSAAADDIAMYYNSAWYYFTPFDGYLIYDKDTNVFYKYENSSWVKQDFPRIVSVPSTASSSGNPGEIAYDSSYFYICTATNTWLRVAIATW